MGKRRHEIVLMEGRAASHRPILKEYNIYLLDQMISVVTASTLLAYCLYTISEETVAKFGTRNLIFTVPFVLYGIFRHEVLVDLLLMQKEIHPSLFCVINGTVCGNGAGPRTMHPVIENIILASGDSVAVDSIAAKKNRSGFQALKVSSSEMKEPDKTWPGGPDHSSIFSVRRRTPASSFIEAPSAPSTARSFLLLIS